MIVTINGREKKLRAGTTLKTAIAGEPHVPGTAVSVRLSEEKLIQETDDFEIETERGTMVMHLNDSPEAAYWRENARNAMAGINARWVTHNIAAFGSFPTDIALDRSEHRYYMYDCFFALGGYDNHTTYIMVARDSHVGSYGAGHGLIGRITVGRHLLGLLKEGDRIVSVRPMMSETRTENVIVTDDMGFKLGDGYRVETNVTVRLDRRSPESAEHVLVLSSDGTMQATGVTGSFVSCSQDLDVRIPAEDHGIREKGSVAVRNQGPGTGRVYIYKDRRQLSQAMNTAGMVVSGASILDHAEEGERFTIVTDPPRALAVGMTQKEGEEFLRSRGIAQTRTGLTDDDAIIAEQSPEHTLTALSEGEVATFGVEPDRVFKVALRGDDPDSARYFRKVTGLSHKPIGSLKVQFTFEGVPMVTFYGDEGRGKNLYPQEPFKRVRRGDIGVTNQARPHHGLIGIRLSASKEYGPTGEEAYGTNIIGSFADDLDRLMDGLEDESVVYIREERR